MLVSSKAQVLKPKSGCPHSSSARNHRHAVRVVADLKWNEYKNDQPDPSTDPDKDFLTALGFIAICSNCTIHFYQFND